jgi:hypothetical protein
MGFIFFFSPKTNKMNQIVSHKNARDDLYSKVIMFNFHTTRKRGFCFSPKRKERDVLTHLVNHIIVNVIKEKFVRYLITSRFRQFGIFSVLSFLSIIYIECFSTHIFHKSNAIEHHKTP